MKPTTTTAQEQLIRSFACTEGACREICTSRDVQRAFKNKCVTTVTPEDSRTFCALYHLQCDNLGKEKPAAAPSARSFACTPGACQQICASTAARNAFRTTCKIQDNTDDFCVLFKANCISL